MTKIAIRTDSSFAMGSGHVIRCLNLAKKLNTHEVTFICRSYQGNLIDKIAESGFKVIEIRENVCLDDEFSILEETKPEIIIVDQYALDKKWELIAKNFCLKLIAIDDLGREHYSDAILDQNFKLATPSAYNLHNSVLFLGPEYCLLNKDYRKLETKRKYEAVNNILCFFGGSDMQSLTLKIVSLYLTNTLYNWDIVIGGQNQDYEKIVELTKNKTQFRIHRDANYMHRLIANADLFIGAGGSVTWERAFYGLPSLVISVATNQIEINQNLHNKAIINYLGFYEEVSDDEIIKGVEKISKDEKERIRLSQNSYNLNVGTKIENFIDYIKNPSKSMP